MATQQWIERYLEGTGVIIFDHRNRIAYAGLSPRCDETLLKKHVVHDLGYEPVTFHTSDASGQAVYHTNVMMGVQDNTAVVCAEAIPQVQERAAVLDTLAQTGHDTVRISLEQMAHFCGNVLQLQNSAGQQLLVMSQTAHGAFTPAQREMLGQDTQLLPVNIGTIETVGGGSARCMLAEVFLPPVTE